MSALEKMIDTVVTSVLRSVGGDVETIKADVVRRIEQFEQNVRTLNETLIAHHEALARIEQKLELISSANVSATHKIGTANDDTGTKN